MNDPLADYRRDYTTPHAYDKDGNLVLPDPRPTAYETVESAGRAPYVLLGLLALVAVVGATLYFHGDKAMAPDVATAPPAARALEPAPASPLIPARDPARVMGTPPAPITTPAPAGAPATTRP